MGEITQLPCGCRKALVAGVPAWRGYVTFLEKCSFHASQSCDCMALSGSIAECPTHKVWPDTGHPAADFLDRYGYHDAAGFLRNNWRGQRS